MRERYCKVTVEPGMTDEEIKVAAREMPNGNYCEIICRNCGIILLMSEVSQRLRLLSKPVSIVGGKACIQ